MKNELIFATNNKHKAQEMERLMQNMYVIKSLGEIGFTDDIEEPYDTLEKNAEQKANTIFSFCNINTFADDTGLFVPALNGAPGVHSARYAGEPSNNINNIQLLLKNLETKQDRKAYFKTVICYVANGESHFFEGKIDGEIIMEQRGSQGFGYDSIFLPNGFTRTFGEMSAEEKNTISHRAKAFQAFKQYLLQR